MTRPRKLAPILLLFVGGAVGCAQLESDHPNAPAPAIAITGPHAVTIGQTIGLTATTSHGADTSYTFASADSTIATVDATGIVTGVAPGETTVTVTGGQTLATATTPIVVEPSSGTSQVPFYAQWKMSPHSDSTAEAFNHWNQQASIPVECARCHSRQGFIDYLGGDGSTPFVVDQPAPVGSVVDCQTCHNPAANTLTQVTFPSGVTVAELGNEARCMTCHQGRSSGPAVDTAIAAAAPASDDTVSASLRAMDNHYTPAAATLEGGRTLGGYQYPGHSYDVRFRHVDGYDTCIGCHDPHSSQVVFTACATCHAGVTDAATAHQIRMESSVGIDYDGDGKVSGGIYDEVKGLLASLGTAITRYGAEHHTPICYAGKTYPYWFADADGTCSAAETTAANAFAGWTARLVRATYNYQMVSKDPGAFAHNAKYVIELLYDSITDLDTALMAKVDLSKATRVDSGHFDGSDETFRHWDTAGVVDATCSSCHGGGDAFRFYVQYGVGEVVKEPPNGLQCSTCHDKPGTDFKAIAVVPSVTFPSGVVRNEPGHDNLCETCHKGREAKSTVDAAIAAGKPAFKDVHHLPAGATKLGSAAHVGYEYPGKTYVGALSHIGGAQCTSCHNPAASHHTFAVADSWNGTCSVCHADANGDPQNIRVIHTLDYDGDGNTGEQLSAEIDGLAATTLAAMQATAPGLCYADSYPYFFKDSNGDGSCSATEAVFANAFAAWTAGLSKAAFNYQLYRSDPAAWAHNFDYIAELLYDSTQDLGGDVSKLTRP
jgi:predicted CXXCH cytochrome family protein